MNESAERADATAEAPPPRRPFARSSSDRIIGGVAGGIAAYLDVDPLLVRLAFVALVLLGPLSPLVYVGAWALMPLDDPGAQPSRRGRSLVTGALVAFGLLLLFGPVLFALFSSVLWLPFGWIPMMDFHFEPEAIVLAGLLIAAGVILLRAPRRAVATPSGDADATAAGMALPPVPVVERLRRERSILPWLTIAAVLVVLGVVAMLENVGAVEPRLGRYPALALTVVGTGLLVGAWYGRARSMMLIGVLLVPAALMTSVIDVPLRGSVGSHYVVVDAAGRLDPDFHVAFGELTLDLSQVDFEGTRASTEITVAAGSVTVYVPRDVAVAVTAYINAGRYDLFGRYGAGTRLRPTVTSTPRDAAGRLDLYLRGGAASFTVVETYDDAPRQRYDRARRDRGRDVRKDRAPRDRRDR